MADLPDYLRQIRLGVEAGTLTERSYYSALKKYIEEVGSQDVTATVEPKRIECGAPDFVISRESPHGLRTIGYIEAKEIGRPLDEVEHSDQMRRYLRSLPNLILTNYIEFRWYIDGEHRRTDLLARIGKDGKIVPDKEGGERVVALLNDFLAHTPEPIAKPRDLARRMARLTHIIRDTIVEAFEGDRATEMLRDLRKAFATTLIPDLEDADKTTEFADMYAPTIAYGLFAARCNHRGPERFQRLGAAAEIPKTNPFLRKLFETITGTELDNEPYAGFVDDLVQLLADAAIDDVLADLGKRQERRDPILHFYETFLADYDPRTRERRGVYYTPEPVVSYIVRSVDYILKTRFDLPGGLADTATIQWTKQVQAAGTSRKIKKTSPRVLILDPACGTGSFLYAVVDHIRRQFMERNDAGMWSDYVREHLLRRLFGFELLMAPYAVAHFKLAMQLAAQDLESGAVREKWSYDFHTDERLGIYLTNTLEEAVRPPEMLFARWIADEANAAAEIKHELPILVIMGNPPYSGHSANRSVIRLDKPEIIEVLSTSLRKGKTIPTKRKKKVWVKKTPIGQLLRDYYQVDGQPLGERNPKWLQDDYVKFIRWGQWRIDQTGRGVLGLVTNHAYLENPTFRGMRQHLMRAFDEIYILDLHGSAKKREVAPDGSKDENVFDIQQGVAIALFVKHPVSADNPLAKKKAKSRRAGYASAYHSELWGTREAKSGALSEWDVKTTKWSKLSPKSPLYLFVPQADKLRAQYEKGVRIDRIFPLSCVGVVTARDCLAIRWDKADMLETVREFVRLPAERAREKHGLGEDSQDWAVSEAQKDLRQCGISEKHCIPILYRPFDTRYTYYTGQSGGFICRPRAEVMGHMLGEGKLGMIVPRRVETAGPWQHALVSRQIIDHVALSLKTIDYLCPLYVYQTANQANAGQADLPNASSWPAGKDGRVPNLDPRLVEECESRFHLTFVSDGSGDLKKTFGPEDVFHYIYALLYSPTYRKRYAEFLKRDFPHVPLTSDRKLFRKIFTLGADLVALHLLEDDYPHASWTLTGNPSPLTQPTTRYPVPGDNRVEKGCPRYLAPGQADPETKKLLSAGRVYISFDDPKTGAKGQYFDGVPPEVWEFHVGGYQVCKKWLKDRRGRTLSFDDLTHYQKTVVALNETIRLMAELDRAIPSWPIE